MTWNQPVRSPSDASTAPTGASMTCPPSKHPSCASVKPANRGVERTSWSSFGIITCSQCSADFQSAVSPTSSRQGSACTWATESCWRPADWKSAIQQIGNLRYVVAPHSFLEEAEVLVNQLHRHRPFAHAGGDAFGGAMTDVTGNEYSRNAGFEVERITIRSPAGRAFSFKHQVLTGNEVTLRIPLDHSGEPIRAGNGPRVNQQRAGGHSFRRTCFVVLNGDSF